MKLQLVSEIAYFPHNLNILYHLLQMKEVMKSAKKIMDERRLLFDLEDGGGDE